MGNLSSCFQISSSSSKNKAKLVDSQGQQRLVELPIRIAELMMENPGYAVSPVDELRRTHRVPAMRADDMLLGGKVYLLVPVDKVNARLSNSQLANIDSLICSKNKRRTRGGSKVSPMAESSGLTGGSLEELVKDLGGMNNGVIIGQRKRFCKTWEPVLEPIYELC